MSGFGLTASDLAEMKQMLGTVEAELEAPAPKEEAAPAQETVVEQKSEAAPEAPVVDKAPEPKPEEESIRPVPYNRFKEVNAERAALKAERDAMANELAEMRAKAEALKAIEPPAPKQKSWVERVLDGDDDKEVEQQAAPQRAPAQEEIPAWARPLIEERQMAELERVVSMVRQDYPDLPEEVILSGLASNQSVHEIAVAWDRVGRAYAQAHGYVPKEQAAPAAQPVQQQQAARVDVAPRLAASKGGINAPEPPSWVRGWGKEHQNAVAQYIKTQG